LLETSIHTDYSNEDHKAKKPAPLKPQMKSKPRNELRESGNKALNMRTKSIDEAVENGGYLQIN